MTKNWPNFVYFKCLDRLSVHSECCLKYFSVNKLRITSGVVLFLNI